jgi:lipopolysaccharide transport system permease protein
MLAWHGVALSPALLLLPLLVLLATLLAVGVGMWMSAKNVQYRDIRYALPFLIQLWMFATPVIYPASLVPERWRWLFALNPLTGIIEAFRAALFGLPLDLLALALSAALTVVILLYSAAAFRRLERSFADVI